MGNKNKGHASPQTPLVAITLSDSIAANRLHNLKGLSADVLVRIFAGLDMNTIHNLFLVCKSWRKISRTDAVWSFLSKTHFRDPELSQKSPDESWCDFFPRILQQPFPGCLYVPDHYKDANFSQLIVAEAALTQKGSPFKFTVSGGYCVGKSNLTIGFTSRKIFLSEDYDPTIEDVYTLNKYKIPGHPDCPDLSIHSFDICPYGSWECSAMRDPYRPSQGFLVLYDTNNPKSLADVRDEVQRIYRDKDPEGILPIILVGTKIDLPRATPQEDAIKLAKELNLGYIETTVATPNKNYVDFAFISLLSMVAHYLALYPEPKQMTQKGIRGLIANAKK